VAIAFLANLPILLPTPATIAQRENFKARPTHLIVRTANLGFFKAMLASRFATFARAVTAPLYLVRTRAAHAQLAILVPQEPRNAVYA
jgi:hypothetical protein